MWVFSTLGFFSTVSVRKDDGSIDPSRVMVRARLRDHLASLQAKFPALASTDLIETPDADYRWRIVVDKQSWVSVISHLSDEIDYGNFKQAAASEQRGHGYVAALHDVWSVMHRLQQSAERLQPREV